MTYFVFHFLHSFQNFFSARGVFTGNILELFIKVELHISHFEIMTSYFKTSSQLSIFKNPDTDPFSTPESF